MTFFKSHRWKETAGNWTYCHPTPKSVLKHLAMFALGTKICSNSRQASIENLTFSQFFRSYFMELRKVSRKKEKNRQMLKNCEEEKEEHLEREWKKKWRYRNETNIMSAPLCTKGRIFLTPLLRYNWHKLNCA